MQLTSLVKELIHFNALRLGAWLSRCAAHFQLCNKLLLTVVMADYLSSPDFFPCVSIGRSPLIENYKSERHPAIESAAHAL